jgi:hypothetical protein
MESFEAIRMPPLVPSAGRKKKLSSYWLPKALLIRLLSMLANFVSRMQISSGKEELDTYLTSS